MQEERWPTSCAKSPSFGARTRGQQVAAEGFKISDRGFLNRVWPQARVDAGLDAVAPSGRPATEDGSSCRAADLIIEAPN